MRAANGVWAALQPHTKAKVNSADFMLFPDEAHDVPENADDQERAWMLKLARMGS